MKNYTAKIFNGQWLHHKYFPLVQPNTLQFLLGTHLSTIHHANHVDHDTHNVTLHVRFNDHKSWFEQTAAITYQVRKVGYDVKRTWA